jgi:anti-sigma factor RsiW
MDCVVSAAVESARREWEESNRLLEAEAADRRRYERLLDQVDAVSAELRRRIGQTFTLAELVDEYGRVDRWSRDAIAASGPPPGWPRTLSVVEGAAFHRYARGAVDYEP